MFTGIITDIGTIISVDGDGDISLKIKTKYDVDNIDIGASIACSGVCLTVVDKSEDNFVVNVSAETLSCTNVGQWEKGSKINLERALSVGDELGGHIVSGHVDALAEVILIEEIGDSHKIGFKVPDNLKQYIAAKGSITLDGVSLTVNAVDDNVFYVNIIPHTFKETTFSLLAIGSKVNLEIDVLARYVARMREVAGN
ncbi:riboflavin synthase [Rickettsiales bacterium]|nr:riboflavin synthase [Rickettsiales bacterium]